MDNKHDDLPDAAPPVDATMSVGVSPGLAAEATFVEAAMWRSAGRKTMARKKVSTTIYIEPEQLDLLKILNERTKVPMAEYIREGIDLVLKRHQDKLPGQLALEPAARPRPAGAVGSAVGAPPGGTAGGDHSGG